MGGKSKLKAKNYRVSWGKYAKKIKAISPLDAKCRFCRWAKLEMKSSVSKLKAKLIST